MTITIALLGFNDLGRSVTPYFFDSNRFYLQLSPHYPKMNKKSIWEVKKIHDFCPRDIESCHHVAATRMKLWSLSANLFLKEPHQLTKFTKIGPFKPYLAANMSLQSSNCNILGLAATVGPSSLTKPYLLRFKYSGHVLSKTKSVTPYFFSLHF